MDLTRLDAVVISHRHGDHTTGLEVVVAANPRVPVYVPQEPAFFGGGAPKVLSPGRREHPRRRGAEAAFMRKFGDRFDQAGLGLSCRYPISSRTDDSRGQRSERGCPFRLPRSWWHHAARQVSLTVRVGSQSPMLSA